MTENTETELGEVKIHHNVIASIAIEAAVQIPGIVKISGGLKTSLLGSLGIKDYSAVKIRFDKNNEAVITIPVVVKYGYNIAEIAIKAQENIKSAVENSAGINIKEINISVQEIESTKNANV